MASSSRACGSGGDDALSPAFREVSSDPGSALESVGGGRRTGSGSPAFSDAESGRTGIKGAVSQSAALFEILRGLQAGEMDRALEEVSRRQQYLRWQRLPDQVVLLRHGQSEGNIDRNIYTSKGDAHLELTPKGLQQARAAGARLRDLVGTDAVFVVVSPFERTLQTLLGLYQGGFPESQVGVVHVSSQIREQEFGNFQSVGLHEAARAEQAVVGRFYYRRPNAESSADVYDRVGSFWTELISDILPRQDVHYGTCLVVTHGLTMRLMLMKIFQWSVETFETVWNVENCNHITLRKDMDQMVYKLCPESSFPKQLPWATRPIWVVFKTKKASAATEEKLALLKRFKASKDWGILRDQEAESMHNSTRESEDPAPPIHAHSEVHGHWLEIDRAIDETENRRIRERAEPFTVLDYLTIPQPRTMQQEGLRGRLIRGHAPRSREAALKEAMEAEPFPWEDVEMVDWWGNLMSYQGKTLRTQTSPHRRLVRHLSADAQSGDEGQYSPFRRGSC
mmetsp:Transcript_31079/g.89847  ORF Transcript_31079/g.89847 Transcript_31079/m.89847 type:complete len:509 (-) Transcript_31079:252-1778(-)